MNKTIKNIGLVVVIATTFIFTSCFSDVGEPVQRTEETELAEINAILSQIEEQGLDLHTTELGIYYLIDTLGTGPLPQAGDTCFMKYTGFFLDGTIFDDSKNNPDNPDGVWEFIYKDISLIPGFDDGIALMSKGTRLDMIVPSILAYGANGSYSIPPYTPVMFSAEMVDLKPFVE